MAKYMLCNKVETHQDKSIVLSIITVVHNDQRRLEATVNSLQKFFTDTRFEYIVIDGGSVDGTFNFLQKTFLSNKIKFISEPDSGIYDAMNKGVRLASGQSILFLNCGDRMLASPELVHSWLHPLVLDNKFDILCFSSHLVYGTDITTLIPKISWPYRMPTSHQAMVFSISYILDHPFDARYIIAGDFNLYLKSDNARVFIYPGAHPITAIEAVGIASENPVKAYKEYLCVAEANLAGFAKFRALLFIGTKAVCVIVLKKMLPRRWVAVMRRKL